MDLVPLSDLTKHVRTGSGSTTFTNGPLGVTARNTSSGLTFTTRTPDETILDEHGGKTTVNAESGSGSADFNPWPYTGAYYNADGAGTYKLSARYYDAQGHFTQPDSLQGTIQDPATLNSYGYTSGDPINNTDPSGLYSVADAFGTVADFGGAEVIGGGAIGCAVAVEAGCIPGAGAGGVIGGFVLDFIGFGYASGRLTTELIQNVGN